MRKHLSRRLMWTGLAMLTAALALALGLPYAASTRLVGERIGDEMRAWSGFDVAVAEPPEIEIWPDLQANLTGVSLSLPDGSASLAAERVEIELSALAALGGSIEFSRARFIRPTLRIEADTVFAGLPQTSRVGAALQTARDIVAENRLSPDRARLPADAFGTVEFEDGRIVRGPAAAPAELAVGLTGKLDWENLNGKAILKATGTVRGETVSANLSTGNGLLLLGGAGTPVSLAIKSGPVDLDFEGTASLGDGSYADGSARLSIPSMRRLVEWSAASATDGPELGSIVIDGRIMGDGTRLRLEDAAVTLDGQAARGGLDLALSGGRPKLSGTLAFGKLDLAGFLKTFTPLDATGGNGPRAIDPEFANRLNLDLRLSAGQATIGALNLTDLAATARVEETLAAFDISDASTLGGDIQAGLRFDRKGDQVHAEVRLLASDIDGAALGSVSGMTMVPQARGSLSLILRGDGDSWQALLAQADGSFSASFGQGSLAGLDIDGLISRARAGAPFPLAAAAGTSTMTGMEVEATLGAGKATIDRAEIRSQLNSLAVTGGVGLGSGMLALRGTSGPPPQAAAGTQGAPSPTTFLIDGPWRSATVNPAAVITTPD